MNKSEKRLKLLEKYADKMHKAFCEAFELKEDETGGIRCLLRPYVNCYYSDLQLIEWELTNTISITYFRNDKKVYISITIDKEIPKTLDICKEFQNYREKGSKFLLQPNVVEKEDNMCAVEFSYSRNNVGMKELQKAVFEPLSQYASEEINQLLDPIMTKIMNYKGGSKNA